MFAQPEFRGGGMTSGADNAAALLKEAKHAHPSTRWLIYQRVAREFGEGFADLFRRQVEASDRKRSQRTPRAQRKGRSS